LHQQVQRPRQRTACSNQQKTDKQTESSDPKHIGRPTPGRAYAVHARHSVRVLHQKVQRPAHCLFTASMTFAGKLVGPSPKHLTTNNTRLPVCRGWDPASKDPVWCICCTHPCKQKIWSYHTRVSWRGGCCICTLDPCLRFV
jgi:hypothetical protein